MALFTAETARAAAAASVASRRAAAQRIPPPTIFTVQPATTIATTIPALDEFQARRLMRVRSQLSRIDTELETCSLKDSKRLKELTDASARLSDQEFKLAGRPSPGSRRPKDEADPKRRGQAVRSVLIEDETLLVIEEVRPVQVEEPRRVQLPPPPPAAAGQPPPDPTPPTALDATPPLCPTCPPWPTTPPE